jgi:adenylate cyclase
VSRVALWAALLLAPVAGLALLLSVPSLDVHWERQPPHFWLVLSTGIVTGGLAFLTGEAAARRGDSRVLRLSIAFVCTSGFLGLHALATPGVLLAEKNAGFQAASAIGLLLASPVAAWSALDLRERSGSIVGRRGLLYATLGLILALWAVVSLATLPPLEQPIDDPGAFFLALFGVGAVFYALAAAGYLRLYRRRARPLLLAAVGAFVLLAEGMLAVGLGRNWHATWWEWHLLMLMAFALFARSVWKEWQTEGSTAEIWSDLYEEDTLGHREDLSVLFADLQGFTSYAERTSDAAVRAMLDEYFAAVFPAIENCAGQVVQTVGDAVMAVFRGAGHEGHAARAGLEFQEAAANVSGHHREWPRFRVGVNSGAAQVGLVRAPGARTYTPTGDIVNVGARLEAQARAGEVVVGEATRAALDPEAEVEDLGELPVKGKERPVRAFVLRGLPSRGNEGNESLQDQEAEPEGQGDGRRGRH